MEIDPHTFVPTLRSMVSISYKYTHIRPYGSMAGEISKNLYKESAKYIHPHPKALKIFFLSILI
jgi:hypothetical protein